MANRIKKFNELTKKLQKTIEDAKSRLLNAIIDDSEISKVEKLRLISDNKLFDIKSSLAGDIFNEYLDDYIKKIESNPSYQRPSYGNPIIDNFFSPSMDRYEKYQTIDLADTAEYASDWEDEDDDMIEIFTNRTTNDVYKISLYEFIDAIYNWCIKNEKIGFKMDW